MGLVFVEIKRSEINPSPSSHLLVDFEGRRHTFGDEPHNGHQETLVGKVAYETYTA